VVMELWKTTVFPLNVIVRILYIERKPITSSAMIVPKNQRVAMLWHDLCRILDVRNLALLTPNYKQDGVNKAKQL
jgi:hypothetical protein